MNDHTIKLDFGPLLDVGNRFRRALAELAAAMPDPAVLREQRRREIDAVLREDARRSPAFATARRCVVLAMAENGTVPPGPSISDIKRTVRCLHNYEALRGGVRPTEAARELAAKLFEEHEIAIYERARALP